MNGLCDLRMQCRLIQRQLCSVAANALPSIPPRFRPQIDPSERHKSARSVGARVEEGKDCWSYQIESLTALVKLDNRVTSQEAHNLMQACRRDIVDLMPSEQRILTQMAWEAVSLARHDKHRTPVFYNYALEAFIFQEMDFSEEEIVEDMRRHKCGPNSRTYENFLTQHCRHKRIELALEFLKSRCEANLPLNEAIASQLIFCHMSRGEETEAQDILHILKRREIFFGRSVVHSFLLGAAKHGDPDKIRAYLSDKKIADQVILSALVELCRVAPEHHQILLDGLCGEKTYLASICRRCIKQLVELGMTDVARKLLLRTENDVENNSEKARVIKICPSVILLKELLATERDPKAAMAYITELCDVDKLIPQRAGLILFEMLFENEERRDFAIEVVALVRAMYPVAGEPLADLVGQNCKGRLALASSQEEIKKVFTNSSSLGIKIEHIRVWDIALSKLIPPIPDEGSYTPESLIDRAWVVRNEVFDAVSQSQGGVYSTSVLWGHIIQHLLNVQNPVFFKAAAGLCKNLGTPYAPQRWFLSLGKCLIKTEDVASYADILECSYHGCGKKGDTRDYRVVASSLVHAVNRAFRTQMPIDAILEGVFHEIWSRHLELPLEVREQLCQSISQPYLASAALNLPVLARHQEAAFRTKFPARRRKSIYSKES